MTPYPGLRLQHVASCLIAIVLCFLFALPCVASGPERVIVNTTRPQKLTLTVGKSTIVQSPQNLKRVSIAAPAVAEMVTLTSRQIYLTGKAPGSTNLTLWRGDNTVMSVIDLEVLPDVVGLKEKIHQLMPDENDVRVTATPDAITLSGTVSSTANMDQVMTIAKSYAPGKDKGIVNFMEIGGVHQVMLEVRVSEMSRSLMKKIDGAFNYSYLSDGTSIGVASFAGAAATPSGLGGSLLMNFIRAKNNWTFFIDALKENGLVKVLAEPTLITTSGKTASFLAGGEFPYPVPQSGGTSTVITIEYKTYGVALNFTPTVLSNKKISMQVAPEVSDLDYSNVVSLQGYSIPGLKARRVATTIELADGQSFAIAGLLQDNINQVVDKVPLFGDIPVLGALFRSSNFQKNESELVIIVTPHLVKPLDMSKQTLPTDQYIEPNDFEFYLMGSMEGQGKNNSTTPASSTLPSSKTGGLEGDFGYIRP